MSGQIEHFWGIFHTNEVIFCSFYILKLKFSRIWLIIIQSLKAIWIINYAIIDIWRELLMSGQIVHFWGIFHTNEVIFCSFYKLKLYFWRIWPIIIQSLKAIWIINYAIIDILRELLMFGQNEHFWGIFHTLKLIKLVHLILKNKYFENCGQ